ncbi:hypothetical protein PTSG_01620 [Salpingoeca rosetta]|uniref:SH2 domain-containing protein n=1 Tax=Salpingoeca rosetta (strain ATCC 50818 / BSB-021) TaxID=946362 RepID=F2TYG8_SALR5|nr:uncharacterized protein PTSG_01620 [Salpingoeca rosetta]EGD78642.1 hypothetical protein PTSG_01620 [Salpingoeca rosetta]|eukprot:XP_004997600.1 hypothetical protein PTSG_01620 [Salpingoeca rosetta]
MDAYESLFDLLAKAQGGRMDDQRASGPSLGGTIVQSPSAMLNSSAMYNNNNNNGAHHSIKNKIGSSSRGLGGIDHRRTSSSSANWHVQEHSQHNQPPSSRTSTSSANLRHFDQPHSPHHAQQQPQQQQQQQQGAYTHSHVYEVPVQPSAQQQVVPPPTSSIPTSVSGTPSASHTPSRKASQCVPPPRPSRPSLSASGQRAPNPRASIYEEPVTASASYSRRHSSNGSGNYSHQQHSRKSSMTSSLPGPPTFVPRKRSSTVLTAKSRSSSIGQVALPHVAPRRSISGVSNLETYTWYVGKSDRKQAEDMLRHWPAGTFVVRQGRSSHVITLKFPVSDEKIFFHVRITHEAPIFRIADSECFKTIPELITFYCNNPDRFFRGMSREDSKKHQLLPYRPLPKLQLDLEQDTAHSDA